MCAIIPLISLQAAAATTEAQNNFKAIDTVQAKSVTKGLGVAFCRREGHSTSALWRSSSSCCDKPSSISHPSIFLHGLFLFYLVSVPASGRAKCKCLDFLHLSKYMCLPQYKFSIYISKLLVAISVGSLLTLIDT